MSKGITPIANTNDLAAIVRQANQNFQILANRTIAGGGNSTGGSYSVKLPGSVTDSAEFAVYYDASGLARVAIGSITSTGEEVIAISADGVNVITALKRNPIIPSDFYFNSSLVNNSISGLQASVSALTSRLTTDEENISQNTGDISDLAGRVTALETTVSDLGTRMTAAELELADHETRIQALENASQPSNP